MVTFGLYALNRLFNPLLYAVARKRFRIVFHRVLSRFRQRQEALRKKKAIVSSLAEAYGARAVGEFLTPRPRTPLPEQHLQANLNRKAKQQAQVKGQTAASLEARHKCKKSQQRRRVLNQNNVRNGARIMLCPLDLGKTPPDGSKSRPNSGKRQIVMAKAPLDTGILQLEHRNVSLELGKRAPCLTIPLPYRTKLKNITRLRVPIDVNVCVNDTLPGQTDNSVVKDG